MRHTLASKPLRLERRHAHFVALLVCAVAWLLPRAALSAPKRGEWLETNVLSSTLVSRDFTTNTTTNVSDAVNLGAAVGLHYYFVDAVRAGVSFQYVERLWPEPAGDASRFQRFAIMPQIAWNFWDPFFVATLFTYAPRTRGRAIPDMSISVMAGVGVPLSRRLRLGVSFEAPYAFYYHQTLSLVALAGVSVRF